jgi:ribosomal protein S27AE
MIFKFIGLYSEDFNDELNSHDYIFSGDKNHRKIYTCSRCGLKIYTEHDNSFLFEKYPYQKAKELCQLTCGEIMAKEIL